MRTHPPKVPLAIRVGVIGLGLRELTSRATLKTPVRNILAQIRTLGQNIHLENFEIFKPVGPTFRVISALASGSQQLVAEEALSLAFELDIPLPIGRTQYRASFVDESSRQTFDKLIARARRVLELNEPSCSGETPGEAVGRVILRQSDILLAIWDGIVSTVQGGTGELVKEAMQRKMPVIWINTSDSSISLLESISAEGDSSTKRELTTSILSLRLREILALPFPQELRALCRFYNERQRRLRFPIVYPTFQTIFGGFGKFCLKAWEALKVFILGPRQRAERSADEITPAPAQHARNQRSETWLKKWTKFLESLTSRLPVSASGSNHGRNSRM